MPPPTLNSEEPAKLGLLGINHQSPLIYCVDAATPPSKAGNQSPIPFDILAGAISSGTTSWESITNPL